jgi:hypothetical protein
MPMFAWLKSLLGMGPTATGVSPFPSGRGPSRLLVLRHAEKPESKRDRHLSPEGQARAERLVDFIPQSFGRPNFLVAAAPGKRSDRPVLTLAPLARSLGLTIMDEVSDNDIDDLVARLRDEAGYAGKSGVICWRHSDIPGLLALLGAPEGTFPAFWGEDVYDLMFEIDYRERGPPKVRPVRCP